MSRQSLQIELAERPTGNIIPGRTFRQRTVAAPTADDLQDGQLLLENLYLSLDPAMRGWLEDRRSYLPPVKLGEVMRGAAIARVLASRSAKARAGDIVTATMGFAEVRIVPEALVEEAIPLPPNGKVTDLLGVLGMTGLTAYFGMTKIGEPKAGDTVVVTAAAGATGSVAAQIAKIAGARVVGTAGSDEKVRWLEELGLDVALNYKDADFKEKFKQATPNFIDVLFDNGGYPPSQPPPPPPPPPPAVAAASPSITNRLTEMGGFQSAANNSTWRLLAPTSSPASSSAGASASITSQTRPDPA